jgi:hypothetical protein
MFCVIKHKGYDEKIVPHDCELGVNITQIWRNAIGRRNIELLGSPEIP